MKKEVFTCNNVTYERVTKAAAERAYNNGDNLIIAPINLNMNIGWYFQHVTKDLFDNKSFEQLLNEYMYYNCNNILGNYVKYFMEVK